MGEACSMDMPCKIHAKFWPENLKVEGPLEDLGEMGVKK
jgi:hypothetical protein